MEFWVWVVPLEKLSLEATRAIANMHIQQMHKKWRAAVSSEDKNALTSSSCSTMMGFLGMTTGLGLIFIKVFGLEILAGGFSSCIKEKKTTLLQDMHTYYCTFL